MNWRTPGQVWQWKGLVLVSQQLGLVGACWIQVLLLFSAAVAEGKVLDKKSVKCANQAATKFTKLQLANFWQITLSALGNYQRNLMLTNTSNTVNYIGLSFFISLYLSLFPNLSAVPTDYQTCTIWWHMIPPSFWCPPNNVIKVGAALPAVFGQIWEQNFSHWVA